MTNRHPSIPHSSIAALDLPSFIVLSYTRGRERSRSSNHPARGDHRRARLRAARADVRHRGPADVLRPGGLGYDGKGQTMIPPPADAPRAIDGEFVYEAFIDFDREVSVVASRSVDGTFAHWGVIENTHRNHILDLSVSPAYLS